MKQLAFTVIVCLLTACAGSSRPDWLEGTAKDFPQAQYLTATGSAANPEDASTRALGNLAKIFEVQIDETSRDESSAWRKADETGVAQGSSQFTARNIDAYTTKLLEGARIAETWRDNEQGQHYALAVISRSQLSMKLRNQISQSDRYTAQRLTESNGLSDPILRAQKIYSAKSALKAREQSQRDLQIVDRTGVGVPSRWTTKDLDVLIDSELAKMTVSDSVLQDPLGELDKSLQSAITAMGMQYKKTEAGYDLQGSLDLQDVGLKEGWYWYRGALQVDLLSKTSKEIMASARFPLKSSGQSQQQSRIRMQNEIARLLNDELKHALLSFGSNKQIKQ
jgi:hypothetical protein